jgi:hypothetical protein
MISLMEIPPRNDTTPKDVLALESEVLWITTSPRLTNGQLAALKTSPNISTA